MPKFNDLTNKRFGRLIAIRRVGVNSTGMSMWLCKCDCGKESIVQSGKLTFGSTVSCGCYNYEMNQKNVPNYTITHHMSNSRLYSIWQNMKSRCSKTNNKRYPDYGGRGITVCDKWLTFEGFYEDMYEGYSDDLSIDRIDVNGNYEKSNCKWSTIKEQSVNKRNNIIIEYNGEKQTLSQLSEKYNIRYNTLAFRIRKSKWTIEKALTTPVQ